MIIAFYEEAGKWGGGGIFVPNRKQRSRIFMNAVF
jgi:hypothetical protein